LDNRSRDRLQRQGRDTQTLNLSLISVHYSEYTGIVGDIMKATITTAQILQSEGQPQFTHLADFLTVPRTTSHPALAGTASLPISPSDDPSSPSSGNISNNREPSPSLMGGIPDVVVVQLEDP